MDSIDHILVVFDDSPASRRALREAAAVADRHRARISVVSLINYERRTVGCCIRSELWNGILDEVALGELDQARQLLGERSPPASFDIVPGSGVAGIRRTVSRLGCDLVVVPIRGLFGRLSIRRLRDRVEAEVVAVPRT